MGCHSAWCSLVRYCGRYCQGGNCFLPCSQRSQVAWSTSVCCGGGLPSSVLAWVVRQWNRPPCVSMLGISHPFTCMLGCICCYWIVKSIVWWMFLPCQLPGCLCGDRFLGPFPLDGVPPKSGSRHQVSIGWIEYYGVRSPLVCDIIKVFLYCIVWQYVFHEGLDGVFWDEESDCPFDVYHVL